MLTRNYRKILSIFGSCAIISTMVVATPETVGAQAADGRFDQICSKPILLIARGSGEGRIDDRTASTGEYLSGWQGNMIDRVIKKLDNSGDLEGVEIMALDDNEYPAIAVNLKSALVPGETALFGETVRSSASKGTIAAVNKIARYKRDNNCEPTVTTLGYSQGTIALLSAEKGLTQAGYVDGSAYMGNPFRVKNDQYNIGDAHTGEGVFVVRNDGSRMLQDLIPLLRKTNEYIDMAVLLAKGADRLGLSKGAGESAQKAADSFRGRSKVRSDLLRNIKNENVVDYCIDNDLICDFTVPRIRDLVETNGGAHGDYFKEDAAKAPYEKRFLEALHSALYREDDESDENSGTPGGSVEVGPPREVMFVIDTTGSMWDDIAEAKANAAEIGQKVLSTNPDSRIGLVEYKDWDSPMYVNGESTAARVVVPLTKDFSIFNERLQALSADGGDEELPEDMLSGIALAQEANWSVPRTRDILVIGDQPAHDPECRTGLTLEALKARSSANSFTFGAEQWPRNPGGYSKDSSCLTPILGINRSANGENRMSRAIQVGSEDLASDNSQPIRISAVTNNPDMANSIKDLIDFTGGVVVSYQDAQSADAIITATANLESSPEAILSIPGFMAVGETVPMSGALSKVFVTGGMSATIDFGDGTVEKFESWDDLFDISHVYSTPGSYTVELRVFDSAGNVGIDRVDIEVMSEDGARVFDYALGEWSLSSYRTDAEPPVQSDDTSSFHGTSSLKSENIFSSLMKVLAVLSIFGGVISAIFSFLSSSRR